MNYMFLENMLEENEVSKLSYGKIGDKLGDIYEKLVSIIFQDLETLSDIIKHSDTVEAEIATKILNKLNLKLEDIIEIESDLKIPPRQSGGNSKTDVLVTFTVKEVDQRIILPISVKQTTAPKVAFAEYDVDTICREAEISDKRVQELMLKHQVDASAKNFTSSEKSELKEKIKPFVDNLLKWIITMHINPEEKDIRYPEWILKFNLDKNGYFIKDWEFYSIEEYIHHIRFDSKGKLKTGGFGTGLSWTYATGSKYKKIQFKG